jgi:hypothetical protein
MYRAHLPEFLQVLSKSALHITVNDTDRLTKGIHVHSHVNHSKIVSLVQNNLETPFGGVYSYCSYLPRCSRASSM